MPICFSTELKCRQEQIFAASAQVDDGIAAAFDVVFDPITECVSFARFQFHQLRCREVSAFIHPHINGLTAADEGVSNRFNGTIKI